MSENSITDNVGAWIGLVGVLIGTAFAFFKYRSGVILVNPSVILDLQNQNTRLSKELDEERERRRKYEEDTEYRFDCFNKSLANTQDKIRTLEQENANLQEKLGMARSILDNAIDWMNEYTPALKAAGIEPLDIDPPVFRGSDDEVNT
jgi:histidyl-tRNA synthetase